MTDVLGTLEFDYAGLQQLQDLCSTAERYNVTTIARVADIGSSIILRYLDRGIMGIAGPHIA